MSADVRRRCRTPVIDERTWDSKELACRRIKRHLVGDAHDFHPFPSLTSLTPKSAVTGTTNILANYALGRATG
jgi:hypothetical protein